MPQLPQKEAAIFMTQVMEHLADWPLPSAEAFRNALLGDGAIAINPLLDIEEESEVEFIRGMLQKAVREGRMIDFGFIPNEVIRTESIRSRRMFEAGELHHPFDSWVATTSWEGGFNIYFFAPHPQWPGAILAMEFYGVRMPGTNLDAVILYDIISMRVEGPGNTKVSPSIYKMPGGLPQSQDEMARRGANSLDPLVTMLRFLADASIPIDFRESPAKLNQARRKKGLWEIPAHTVVRVKDYVSHFQHTKSVRGESKGGTHASPIAHFRRAHLRRLPDGRTIDVRSSKVNWRDNEELHRMFYTMNEKGSNGKSDPNAR